MENDAAAPSDQSTPSHALDNPIWNCLLTEHGYLAEANQSARRYPPAIGPLSGFIRQSSENYEALRLLTERGGVAVLFCAEKPTPPANWTSIMGGVLTQMICPQPQAMAAMKLTRGEVFRPLTTADVPQMVELAELTKPGPFRSRTIELGAFFGIFEAGRLIAMAGERLRLPNYVEVSAVCTHPSARGRGYARMLIGTVMDDIRRRGKIPFLHSFADNEPAIRVYETLGFHQRRTFELAVLKNGESGSGDLPQRVH